MLGLGMIPTSSIPGGTDVEGVDKGGRGRRTEGSLSSLDVVLEGGLNSGYYEPVSGRSDKTQGREKNRQLLPN